ncbi:MAG: hypothetical protein AAF437_05430 [Pseudomonadota bacterium]
MLLRRITKHVKDQNWFAVGLDFFIVVIGILIAFQITSWNDGRSARQLESEYMILLTTDLRTIEGNLSEQLAQEEAIIANARIAIQAINTRESGVDPKQMGHSLISIFGRRTLILDSPVFSEMKSAGRLTLIEDTRLRNRIIAYFDGLVRVESILDKNNEFYVEPYSDFLRDIGLGYVALPADACPSSNVQSACDTSRLANAVFGSERIHAAEEILSVPAEDPLWTTLRSQVVWRAIPARANAVTVQQLLSDTQALLAELEAQK